MSAPRAAEAVTAARRSGKLVPGLVDLRMRDALDDQLRDAIALVDRHRLIPRVEKGDQDLSAIVDIDDTSEVLIARR